MYFALVKVFNIYTPNYILKFCLVGWGKYTAIVFGVSVLRLCAFSSNSGSIRQIIWGQILL